MKERVVAHFLLNPELAHSPPNEALISAYLELGFRVDLFAPGGIPDSSVCGTKLTSFNAEYGYRWLLRNLLSRRWKKYAIFSGTTEDPMAAAGILGRLHGGHVITLADEIRSGSNAGNRGARWKQLCRWGMRRSALTIVNDAVRKALQREYAGLPTNKPIIVYPGSFRSPPASGNRPQTRAQLGIPERALVLCFSGRFSVGNGGLWLASLLNRQSGVHVLGQLLVDDPLVVGLLDKVLGEEFLHRVPSRLGWREAWSQVATADIGMVVYLQDGPQFQNMGISSNRLCMFLEMGVPVIASRQPSFQFIEDYDCGILVDNEAEFIEAIDKMRDRLEPMKANALRCAREYIDAPGKYLALRDALAKAVGVDPGSEISR